MIASNKSGKEIALRWNEYLNTYIADITFKCGVRSFPLRDGEQNLNGIKAVTKVPDSCHRYACDMQQSVTEFS